METRPKFYDQNQDQLSNSETVLAYPCRPVPFGL